MLANENQLPRRRVVLVLKKVMHSKPEIFQTEFAEILAADCERIKIVFLQISPKFAAPFLVFSPKKACSDKEDRRDDRGDDVNADLALQRFDHSDQQTCATTQRFPVKLERVIFSKATSAGRESAYATAPATSSGEIILSRGQSPSTLFQIPVSVAAG